MTETSLFLTNTIFTEPAILSEFVVFRLKIRLLFGYRAGVKNVQISGKATIGISGGINIKSLELQFGIETIEVGDDFARVLTV